MRVSSLDRVFESPDKIFTGNGQKFANSEFIEMNDYLSTNAKTTAAESPRSYGIARKKRSL